MAWVIHPAISGPLTPERWLDIATQYLAPEAKARVRAEYLAYLEDALDAGESRAAVLAEWGDPHRANAELQQAHLTVMDGDLLHPGYALTKAGWQRAMGDSSTYTGDAATLLGYPYYGMVYLLTDSFAVMLLVSLFFFLVIPTLRWLVIGGWQLQGRACLVAAWLLNSHSLMVLTMPVLLLWKGPKTLFSNYEVGGYAMVFVVSALLWVWFLRMAFNAFRKAEIQVH